MLAILDFTRTRIGTITDYEDLEIEHDLENGDKTISFRYLGTDIIKNEYYVETDKARFTIKEVAPDESGSEYHGQLDLEDLQRVPFKRFTSKGQTLQAAAEAALQGTGWTVQTNITTIRNVQRYKVTPLEALYSIRDAWMCEIAFDNLNNVVTFADKIGEDKGVYFMRGLNLRKVKPNYDSYDYVTRLIPYGADGLTIESVNDGIAYVENYQYSTKILTLIWEDTSYEDAQSLKDDAVKKLADLSKPKKSFDCEVINLAKESATYSILDYGIGDTIHLIDNLTGTDELQRIVKYVEHPHAPEEDTCEISNTVLTFEELQDRMQKAADAWEEISNSDGTVNGVYVHGVEMDNIVGIEVLIGDGLTTNGAVANVAVMYAQGDSPTSAPESGWSTTAPTWDDGKYMWQKTVTTYVNGESEETAVTNITGASGQPGENGSGFAWNLLPGTQALEASDFFRMGATFADGIVHINSSPQSLAYYARYITGLAYDDYASGTYTLSFDGREINDGSTSLSGPINVLLGYFANTQHSNFTPSRDKYKTAELASQGEEWKRYSVTFTLPDDLDTGTDAAMVSGSQLQFQFQRSPKRLPFEIKDIKLELGSATDPEWAPHPDDIKGADGISPTVTVSKDGSITTITFTDSTGTETATINDGEKGDTGTRGATWYAGTKITGQSTTAKIFSNSGITDALVGDHYLNTSTQDVYICTVAGDASVAKWKYEQNIKGKEGAPGGAGSSSYVHIKYSDDGVNFTGNDGEDPGAYLGIYSDDSATDSTVFGHYTWTKIEGESGDDAVNVVITSSAGLIFKTYTGTKTLTAKVYAGSVEVTGTALANLGTLKWYKSGTYLTGKDGSQLQVSASDVQEQELYECRVVSGTDIVARGSVTIAHVRDIVSTTWYYWIQDQELDPPAKPTTKTPPTGWKTTEPAYTQGSTNKLYVTERTIYSDDTFGYTEVSLSSSFEAAKAAYVKAVEAIGAAEDAQGAAETAQADVDEIKPELIVGTHGSTATATWTGTSTKLTAITNGTRIQYKLSSAGASNVTLNLTLKDGTVTGAIPVYYLNNTKLGTQYGVGAVIDLIYDGSAWRILNPYTNNTYNLGRRQHSTAIRAADDITTGHLICGTSTGYQHIGASVPFSVSYPILYANANIDQGNTSTNTYEAWNSVNYSNSGTIESGAANKVIYLKGQISGGQFICAATNYLTTVEPTSADGYYYIPLGVMSSGTAGYFNTSNRLFAYIRGEFLPVDVAAKNIVAELITSADGKTYFDLENSRLHCGSNVLITGMGDDHYADCTLDGAVLKFGAPNTKNPEAIDDETELTMQASYNGLMFRTLPYGSYAPKPIGYIKPSSTPQNASDAKYIFFDAASSVCAFLFRAYASGAMADNVLIDSDGLTAYRGLKAKYNVDVYNDSDSPAINFHRYGSTADNDIQLLNNTDTNGRDQLRLINPLGSGFTFKDGGIEIHTRTAQPKGFVDFHYGGDTGDYTARIIENASGALLAMYSISNSSDKRLKKDIVEMDDVYLRLLDKLEPKEYRYKKGADRLNIGFIAQDVVRAMEELGIEDHPIVVGTGEGDDYYGLDYSQITPILVRKCQEQDRKISALEAEVEELKTMVQALMKEGSNQ